MGLPTDQPARPMRLWAQALKQGGLKQLRLPPQPAITAEAPSKKSRWEQHHQSISQCQACARHTPHKIFGRGNPQAKVLFLDLAPDDDDRQGQRLYAGERGQLFVKMLRSIHLSLDDIYLSFITHCPPLKDESAAQCQTALEQCFGFFNELLAQIDPRVVVVMGETASQKLCDLDQPLPELRKQAHNYQNRPLIVTWDPQSLLSTPAYKAQAWEDLKLLRRTLDRFSATKL